MNFKKRVNGSWVDTPNYIHNTSTDTITTLPAVIHPTGTTATVGLKGQAVQSTTPTPDNPIMPNGTGDMSSNLYNVSDKSAMTNNIVTLVDLGADTTVNTITVSCMFDNLLSTGAYGAFLDFLKDDNTHQYVTLSNMLNVADDTPVIANTITTGNYYVTKNNITFRYIKAYLYSTAYNKFQSGTIKWAFYDSEKKDYEPYGYKIPISSASTTTPVYLGEVETTRKIKKLVFDGTENWNYSVTSQAYWVANVPNDYDNTLASQITTVCTHYRCIRNDTGLVGMINGDLRLYAKITSPIAHELYIKDETYTSAANFKAYLQQQYAAGTPVTVWYVLATPETAVVNEPLRKIGDYADTVSGITIPTIAGANTISVDTTLQPSEVTVNYKGWHPVQSVHERESGAWT